MIETLWQQFQDRLDVVEEYEPKTPWDLLAAFKKSNVDKSLTSLGPDVLRLGPHILYHPQIREIAGEFVVLKNVIVVEEDVQIGSFVKLVGPLWLGRGTRIGDYASVSESYVGRNSLVGEYVTVRRSIIADDTKLYHQSLILDSVIGSNVEIAGQLYTANHVAKLPGNSGDRYAYIGEEKHKCPEIYGSFIDKDVKCGPWVSVMPGTYVKAGTKTILPSMISGTGEVRRFVTSRDWYV